MIGPDMPGLPDESEAQVIEILKLQDAPPVRVEMSALLAFMVFSHLQLACRHPKNQGAGRDIVRDFTAALGEKIAPAGSPLAEILCRGWDPGQDI